MYEKSHEKTPWISYGALALSGLGVRSAPCQLSSPSSWFLPSAGVRAPTSAAAGTRIGSLFGIIIGRADREEALAQTVAVAPGVVEAALGGQVQ